jgi:DNA-binding beta-propeller fold protein YncE
MKRVSLTIAFLGAVFTLTSNVATAQDKLPLTLQQSVAMPGYTGDFDHFVVDRARSRVLLAAEDHGTLEVFDLRTGKHLRTVSGFDTPHSILVRPGSPTILVTDGGKSMSKLLDAETYEKKATVTLTEGADSSVYDPDSNVLYVVTGGKDVNMKTAKIEAVDPDTGKKIGEVELNDDHVEAMAIEKGGDRLFVNLAQTNKLAVINRKTMKEIAEWPVPPARQNAMVAFDEPHHRLFIVCRQPGEVVVMNSDTGNVVTTQPAPLRADDVLYDRDANRLYVPGGEGFIAIYDTSDPDRLTMLAKVPSAPGAKTGLLLPDMKKLLLAVSPGDSKELAKVLTFSIE